MNAPEPGPRVTVAITTKGRPDSLLQCLRSLVAIDDVLAEVLVADDGGEPPAERLRDGVPASIRDRVAFLRLDGAPGYIVARNRMARDASAPAVLMLDDDTFLLEGDGIRRALRLLDRHPAVAAVAFAQGQANGTPWPAEMQPAPVTAPARVPAFTGFAHLLRRDVFLDLGGYPESFVFYGEEKDLCLRALDRGFAVVYLPDVVVAHVFDPAGRSNVRYLRQVIRNDCLFALHTEPWPRLPVSIPYRMWRYFPMRRHSRTADPGGFRWILGSFLAEVPRALGRRRAVRWSTLREWRRLGREWPPFVE